MKIAAGMKSLERSEENKLSKGLRQDRWLKPIYREKDLSPTSLSTQRRGA